MLIRLIYNDSENIVEARRVIDAGNRLIIYQVSLDTVFAVEMPSKQIKEKIKKELFETSRADLRKYKASKE